MSQYPEAMSDLGWFRQQIEDLQSQLREVQRGPAVPQPVLQFASRAARDAVAGKPMQWAYVSGDSAPGNNGPFQYFPGTGWKRPHGAETGSLVQMSGSTLPAYSLPFTGGTYNVTDYPDLAAYYGIGSGTFTLFNSGGRALIGSGTVADANSTIRTFTVGEKGGELTHIMSVAEMPSHTHLTRVNTAATFGTSGGGYSYPSIGSYTADPTASTGGNQAHSLMQPWAALPFAVRI